MPETLSRDIKILSGWAFPSDGFNALEGLPLIRIRDLGRSTTEVKFKGRYDPRYVIDDGDVLIGMDGDFSVEKWTGGPALLNQRVCKVESTSADLDQGFLYWYLMPHVAEIHRKTPQTTVRHLSVSSLVEIAAPPLSFAQQRTVNRILNTLDTTIRQTEAVIEKLKQVKQGLLHDLLTRGIDANGQLRPPHSQAPHRYKYSPLGWIPCDWTTPPVSTLVRQVTYGFTNPMPTTLDGPWMLTATDIADGFVDYSAARKTSSREFARLSRKSRPNKGDILVTKDGTLGRVAVLDRENVCVNQSIAVLSPFEAGLGAFLTLYLRSPSGQDRMIADAGGSTIKHIYITKLADMLVPSPPVAEAFEIGQRADALEQRIQLEASLLLKLAVMKSGLMDDLLTGRVRVTPLLQSEVAP